MLKFTGDSKDGRVFFFGLSRGNIDRLTSGQPIRVHLADMDGPKVSVVILFGETEQALFDELKATGAIPDDVKYRMATPGMAEVVRIKREPENPLKLGATGEYGPEGKTYADDAGGLQAAVTVDSYFQRIMVEFGKPVPWINMTVEEAEGFADVLRAKALVLRGMK